MSYTMTIDAPEKLAAYVERRGSRFKATLSSMVLAFVTTEMQQDEESDLGPLEVSSTASGAAFARAWRKIGVGEGELDLTRRDDELREIDFA